MPPHPIPPRGGEADAGHARSPSLPRGRTDGDRRPEPPGGTDNARLDDQDELPNDLVDEVRAQDRRQLELFLKLAGGAAGVLWVFLVVFIYSHSFGRSPLLGVLFAPLLAALGAVIGALPLAIACGLVVLVLHPRHPRAAEVERYAATHPRRRACDVCVLVREDSLPRAGVAYCPRCDAWLCPDCRSRYDLRAIAALRAARARAGPPETGSGAPSSPPD